jgi:prephenate dehydratase
VLAHPINDHPDNCTRFWVVSPDIPAKGTHTALVFSTFVNRPGSLLKSLQLFADQQINMSRIESRPTKRSLGDYWFFVDLEMGLQEPALQKVLASMEATAENLRVLGTYEFLPIS